MKTTLPPPHGFTYYHSTSRARTVNVARAALPKSATLLRKPVPSTSNNDPPDTTPVVPELGSYCMRASTELVESVRNDHVIRSYKGYDEYTTIVQKVEDACIRDNTILGKDTYHCRHPRLFFLGPTENCNG